MEFWVDKIIGYRLPKCQQKTYIYKTIFFDGNQSVKSIYKYGIETSGDLSLHHFDFVLTFFEKTPVRYDESLEYDRFARATLFSKSLPD